MKPPYNKYQNIAKQLKSWLKSLTPPNLKYSVQPQDYSSIKSADFYETAYPCNATHFSYLIKDHLLCPYGKTNMAFIGVDWLMFKER